MNTDYIISSARKRETLDPQQLRRWLLEAVDPEFAASVRPGDMLVAGRGFGGGSAMEVAVTVPLAAGIAAVLARSFSRTYFRNAVNNGLLPVECDTSGLVEGDALVVEVDERGASVSVPERGVSVRADPLPPFVLGILKAGGLVPYLESGGSFGATSG